MRVLWFSQTLLLSSGLVIVGRHAGGFAVGLARRAERF